MTSSVDVSLPSWSFSNAILILQKSNKNLYPSLRIFLSNYRKLLRDPSLILKFDASKTISQADLDKDSIIIENVKYQIPKAQKLSSESLSFLSKSLKIDVYQALRIIIQTIERGIPDFYSEIMSQEHVDLIPESKSKKRRNDPVVYSALNLVFAMEICKEKRMVLELATLLFQNQDHDSYIQDLVNDIIIDNEKYLGTLIAALVDVSNMNVSSHADNEYQHLFANLLHKESSLMTNGLLNLVTQVLIPTSPSDKIINSWFSLVDNASFDSDYTQYLLDIASLLMLGFNVESSTFDTSLSFWSDGALYSFIDSVIADPLNLKSPMLMCAWWSINLQKYSALESDPDTQFLSDLHYSDLAEFTDAVHELSRLLTQVEDAFSYLSKMGSSLCYSDIYNAILKSFAKVILSFASLTPSTISSFASFMASSEESDLSEYINSDSFVSAMEKSKTDFPENIEAFKFFLDLICIDGRLANILLSEMTTYHHYFNQGDLEYKQLDDEYVVLTKDALIKPPFEQSNSLLKIEEGTKGIIVTNDRFLAQNALPVSNTATSSIALDYTYSGWSLVGKVFENILNLLYVENDGGSSFRAQSDFKALKLEKAGLLETVDHEILNRIFISLLELILAMVKALNVEKIKQVIKLFEVTTVTSFFNLLYRALNLCLENRKIHKLTIISDILAALLSLDSDFSKEVWVLLVKSNFFETKGVGSNLNLGVIFSKEQSRKEFKLTISLLKFANILSVDALSIDRVDNIVSFTAKGEILTKITSTFVSFFENFFHWNYKESFEKFQIGSLMIEFFSRVLYTNYSITGSKKPNDKNPLSALHSSGTLLVEKFLTCNSFDILLIKPFREVIERLSTADFNQALDDKVICMSSAFVVAMFDYMKLLISLRSTIIKSKICALELVLLEKLPNLAKIYMEVPKYKLKIMTLLVSLMNVYDNEEKPSSFSSYLGDKPSKILIKSVMSDFEASMVEHDLRNALYDFFAGAISKNQERLAMMFLDGVDLDARKKEAKKDTTISVLKKSAVKLESYPESVAIHLVDAISCALNSWSSSSKITSEDVEFITSLTKYFDMNFEKEFGDLDDSLDLDLSSKVDTTLSKCYKVKLFSSIGEILAVYLYSCSNPSILKPILELLEKRVFNSFAPKLFTVHGYNSELHSNCHTEFARLFPNFDLENFRRTPLNRSRRYGISTVYNSSLMDELFGKKYEWCDFLRMNVVQTGLNLQYVSAQTSMIKSWGAVISSYVRLKSSSDSGFIKLAALLLSINNETGIPAPSFKELYLERVELSFFLVYAMKSKTIEDSQLSKLFKAVVGSLLSEEVNFLVSLTNNDIQIYRSLLRILSITLDLCSNKAHLLEKDPAILVNLINKVLANGSRVIISSIQNDMSADTKSNVSVLNRIEDLTLMISLFKSFVAINFSQRIVDTLSNFLETTETVKLVLDLYSYSRDPVFAELALMYITEMISSKAIAEKLLDHGLVSVLFNSPISLEIQKGGIRSDTDARVHHIWSNGLLTAMLVLLSTFGPRLILDVCGFVKLFNKQIQYTISNWTENSLIITTAIIHETSQLVLLNKVLNMMNYKEYLGIRAEELFPGLDTPKQRSKLVDSLSHLLSHPKYLQSRIVMTNLEDQSLASDTEASGVKRGKLASKLMIEIKDLREALTD